MGLFGFENMPTISQDVVNFSAGFGDALLLMQGERLRGYGCINNVNQNANTYWGGVISGNVTLFAAPILKPFNAAAQTVTHWGTAERIASGVIKEGSWVMIGKKTVPNYILSGSIEQKYAYGNAVTKTVSGAELSYPGGWEWIKGLLGQRIYKP